MRQKRYDQLSLSGAFKINLPVGYRFLFQNGSVEGPWHRGDLCFEIQGNDGGSKMSCGSCPAQSQDGSNRREPTGAVDL